MKHLLPKFLFLICCCLYGTGLQGQDLDADGIPNSLDNCVSIYNPNQSDSNNDGLGDACATCTYTNPLTDLPFLAAIVEANECCFNGFIRQYTYQGIPYFATGQSPFAGQGTFCPSDVPLSIYNCEGNLMCYSGGLLPPSDPNVCDSVLPSDFFSSPSSVIWTCSPVQPCYDPSVIIPDGACITLWDPVCGCDDNTYSNSCVAYSLNGITSWTPGECGNETYNICVGESVQIGTDFVPNTVYQWFPNDGLSCSNCPNPIASPLSTITYTLSTTTTIIIGADPVETTHTIYVDNSCPVPAEIDNFSMCTNDGVFVHSYAVGDEESYGLLIPPANGNVSISYSSPDFNQLSYTPNAGFLGTDVFYLSHSDFNGSGFSTELLEVNITVENCCDCPDVLDPVCGLDGNTYDNSCSAACAGVTVAYDGPCTDCSSPPDVGPCDGVFPRWYFDTQLGACAQFTWGGCGGNANNFETYQLCVASCDPDCLYIPTVYDPVCGSDGNTYNNSYEAECAGISEYFPGACTDCNIPPDVGPCNAAILRWYHDPITEDCLQFVWGGCGGNANNYTSYELCIDNCRPCICTSEYDPVCGSDGITYSNDCFAQCAGVSWTAGECPDDECYDPSVIYPNIDCTSYGYNPVCGCNNVTYNNICEAFYLNGIIDYTVGSCSGNNHCDLNAQWLQGLIGNACGNTCASSIQLIEYQGVQYVAYMESNPLCSDGLLSIYNCDGSTECLTGGIAGFNQCPDLVQNYSFVQTLWSASECGNCVCPDVYDPVCGSDGVTYGNSCEANCVGVSWTPGACNDGCFEPSHYLPNTDCSSYGYSPVCGCDGITYDNNCDAYYGAGLEVYYAGPCANDCTCPAVYDPVCGSDGNTYSNSCEAACAGITSWSPGECGVGNGCFDPDVLYNIDCSSYAYDPVCGCNDVTYNNICEAFYLNGITSYTLGACGTGKTANNIHSTVKGTGLPVVICDNSNGLSSSRRIGSSTTYSNAKLRFFDNCVQYIPSASFTGIDYIELKWCDGEGLCEIQKHEIQVKEASATEDGLVNPASLSVRYDQQSPNTIWFVDASIEAAADYKIFNIEGRLVLNGTTDQPQWSLDLNDLNQGVYVIQTENGTSKFLIR